MAPIATDNNSASQFPPKQLHTPAPSIDSSSSQLKEKKDPSPTGSDLLPPSGPVDTPSPGLGVDESDKGNEADEATDASALHALIASVPPQTLHAYTLAHLSPVPLSPFPFANPAAGLILQEPPVTPTPRTLSVLREFFSNLSPPPKLHCVRCHKGYFELENTDRSCLVPHDDDSAIVDRVKTGLGTEYETLWGCCGRTVEGDGDQGPPDGWCYEGRHTVYIYVLSMIEQLDSQSVVRRTSNALDSAPIRRPMMKSLFLVLNSDAVNLHYFDEAPPGDRENECEWTVMLEM